MVKNQCLKLCQKKYIAGMDGLCYIVLERQIKMISLSDIRNLVKSQLPKIYNEYELDDFDRNFITVIKRENYGEAKKYYHSLHQKSLRNIIFNNGYFDYKKLMFSNDKTINGVIKFNFNYCPNLNQNKNLEVIIDSFKKNY